jgi:E3 ubiquitin-protein ligase HUWE1
LYALDGIARHRGKVTEVLSAFNASANHGVLLHILRQLTHQQQHGKLECRNNRIECIYTHNLFCVEIYTAQFLDGVFTLLSFLLQTPSGGQMFMSAGIISTLIQLLEHKDTGEYYTNVLIRAIGLFDTVMGSNSGSFSSFLNSNGLDVLLRQIKDQVQQCIQTEHHDTLTLVKNMLRFLTRLMESGDSIDALRNLIESSIPRSLTNIIEHPKVFGANVFALAINVATTFIHNEPTSLSVLQELGLPQAFLSTFGKYDDPNCEVLMASAHAFGAICLNKPGLDMFNEANPLPHFFELMTHHSFVTNPVEVGGATAFGTTMDELIRHHPPLKQQVFQCATYLLQKVVEVGKSDAGKPLDNCHLLAQTRRTSNLNEKAECVLLGFVDLVSRVSFFEIYFYFSLFLLYVHLCDIHLIKISKNNISGSSSWKGFYVIE